jgi:hypothetical protein
MQTALEQLDRMDALVKRMAGRVATNPNITADERFAIAEARAILADRAPDGFDKVLAVLQREVPLMSDSSRRLLARDVLAALA